MPGSRRAPAGAPPPGFPRKVDELLRHIQTTLDIYTQGDGDETRTAQGAFLTAVGMNATVQ